MSILGALVSMIAAGSYAAIDKAVVDHRIATAQLPERSKTDDKMYWDLVSTFEENWIHDGASLYPEKMIRFLSLSINVRKLWIDQAVRNIMLTQGVGVTEKVKIYTHAGITSELPYGGGASRYDCIGTDYRNDHKKLCGPMYYEYDYVATNYPDDWQAYITAEEQRVSKVEKDAKQQATGDVLLVALGAILIFATIFAIAYSINTGWFLQFDLRAAKAMIVGAISVSFLPFVFLIYKNGTRCPQWIWFVVAALIIISICV